MKQAPFVQNALLTGSFLSGGFGVSTDFVGVNSVGRLPATRLLFPLRPENKFKKKTCLSLCTSPASNSIYSFSLSPFLCFSVCMHACVPVHACVCVSVCVHIVCLCLSTIQKYMHETLRDRIETCRLKHYVRHSNHYSMRNKELRITLYFGQVFKMFSLPFQEKPKKPYLLCFHS